MIWVSPDQLAYVNLGCGTRHHPRWINIDIVSMGPGVIAHDLRTGIPLEDGVSDVVYHAHVLEHIPRREAAGFIMECRRVLKPGGILRVVVPDLEQICRLYLQKLEAATAGELGAPDDYDWMLLELMDQAVREETGGQMRAFLDREEIPNQAFIESRIGAEGRNLIETLRNVRRAPQLPPPSPRKDPVQALRRPLRVLEGGVRRRLVARWFGPDARRAFPIGSYRLSGEVHNWMYDRYSLGRLLTECGFVDPMRRSAQDSAVPDWAGFGLDSSSEGVPHKPDSLYMEALKAA